MPAAERHTNQLLPQIPQSAAHLPLILIVHKIKVCCRRCPAGALVALGQQEKQPMLVVVAADEVAAAQQAGYSPL